MKRKHIPIAFTGKYCKPIFKGKGINPVFSGKYVLPVFKGPSFFDSDSEDDSYHSYDPEENMPIDSDHINSVVFADENQTITDDKGKDKDSVSDSEEGQFYSAEDSSNSAQDYSEFERDGTSIHDGTNSKAEEGEKLKEIHENKTLVQKNATAIAENTWTDIFDDSEKNKLYESFKKIKLDKENPKMPTYLPGELYKLYNSIPDNIIDRLPESFKNTYGEILNNIDSKELKATLLTLILCEQQIRQDKSTYKLVGENEDIIKFKKGTRMDVLINQLRIDPIVVGRQIKFHRSKWSHGYTPENSQPTTPREKNTTTTVSQSPLPKKARSSAGSTSKPSTNIPQLPPGVPPPPGPPPPPVPQKNKAKTTQKSAPKKAEKEPKKVAPESSGPPTAKDLLSAMNSLKKTPVPVKVKKNSNKENNPMAEIFNRRGAIGDSGDSEDSEESPPPKKTVTQPEPSPKKQPEVLKARSRSNSKSNSSKNVPPPPGPPPPPVPQKNKSKSTKKSAPKKVKEVAPEPSGPPTAKDLLSAMNSLKKTPKAVEKTPEREKTFEESLADVASSFIDNSNDNSKVIDDNDDWDTPADYEAPVAKKIPPREKPKSRRTSRSKTPPPRRKSVEKNNNVSKSNKSSPRSEIVEENNTNNAFSKFGATMRKKK